MMRRKNETRGLENELGEKGLDEIINVTEGRKIDQSVSSSGRTF